MTYDAKRWWRNPLPTFDIETTGVEDDCGIVQVSFEFIDFDGNPTDDGWTKIVNPGMDIPEGAAAVHGITNEIAERDGVDLAIGIIGVVERLNKLRDDQPLVIYNAPFDWPRLKRHAGLLGLEITWEPLIIDPLLLDRVFDKYRKGSRKLIDTARVYGVDIGTAHDASEDAKAAAGVARGLVKVNTELRNTPIAELQTRQSAWYREWAEGINAYWASNGMDRKTGTGWPE